MDIITIIGTAAIIGSSLTPVPQVIKICKTRSVKDVSLVSLVISLFTAALWFTYGILINAWSVWLNNIFVVTFAVILVYLKFHFSKPRSNSHSNSINKIERVLPRSSSTYSSQTGNR